MEPDGAGTTLVQKAGRAYREVGVPGVLRRGARLLRNRALTTSCSLWFQKSLHNGAGSSPEAVDDSSGRIAADSSCEKGLHPEFEVADVSEVDSAPRVDVQMFVDDKRRLVAWFRQHHEQFPWMFSPEELEHAEKSEHLYAGFLLGDRIVGYVKVGVDITYVHDFRMAVRFPPDDCFVYDTFVLPEYRALGIARQGIADTLAHLEGRGFRRIWCHIEEWNAPSLRLFRGAGFEEVARVRFVRALGFSFFLRDGFIPSRGLDGLFSRGPRAPALRM